MALLRALNDSYRDEVELQRQKYQLRLVEVKSHKAKLKRRAKAELTRPGTLAAAFTLGVLVAPGGKRRGDVSDGQPAEGSQAQRPASAANADVADDATKDKKQKSKHFDPADLLGSVTSAVLVRLATNWITGLTTTQGPDADKAQDADVDNSTQVDL